MKPIKAVLVFLRGFLMGSWAENLEEKAFLRGSWGGKKPWHWSPPKVFIFLQSELREKCWNFRRALDALTEDVRDDKK